MGRVYFDIFCGGGFYLRVCSGAQQDYRDFNRYLYGARRGEYRAVFE
jgi:hypothetical protein